MADRHPALGGPLPQDRLGQRPHRESRLRLRLGAPRYRLQGGAGRRRRHHRQERRRQVHLAQTPQ